MWVHRDFALGVDGEGECYFWWFYDLLGRRVSRGERRGVWGEGTDGVLRREN